MGKPMYGTGVAGKSENRIKRRGRRSRRDSIVDVAARSFYEKGFDRSSVRAIAAEAGMTSGSIFYHFASKEELLAHVIEEGIALCHQIVERELAGKTDPVGRYRALVLGHLQVLHDQRHMHKVSIREWDRLPARTRNKLKATNASYRDRWKEVALDLSADGALNGDPELFARCQIAALNWTVHYDKKDLADLEALADRLAATSLNMDSDKWHARLRAQ